MKICLVGTNLSNFVLAKALKNKNFSYFDRIGADEIFYNNKYYKF